MVLYLSLLLSSSDDLSSHGILMHAVDNLPAQLPKEATNHFGKHLMPLLPNLMNSDRTAPLDAQVKELNPSWCVRPTLCTLLLLLSLLLFCF